MSRSTLRQCYSAGRSGAVRRPGLQQSAITAVATTTTMTTTKSWRLSTVGILLALFVGLSSQQRDPVRNFCRRFGHQTAVVDDKLFIDGGLVNWNPISTYPDNYTNTWLLYQDLKTVAGSGMPQLQANLSKNASVPSVHGGALWADDVNKRLYLFGGEFSGEPPSRFDLFAYDVLNDYWEDFGSPRSDDVQRVSYGAAASVSSRGEGYYYGGWLSNASVPGWGDAPPVATSQMVKYTMDTGEWTNTKGPDDVRRAEGGMVFIPAGDGGLLVYFGGVRDLAQNGTAVGQRMDQIFVYDVLSGKWYVQKATGQVPERRRRFCTDVAWADDQSSYNIYVYGGAAPADEEGPGFDDLYILSLPTFTWIKMYPNTTQTGDYPHHSLSCNMGLGRAQMLIIGGHFPLMQDCDAPDQWGTHNADLGRQNDDASPWALYEPDKTMYAVPSDVLDVIGGDKGGGATKTAPDDGFDHQDLTALMTRKANIAARTPTRDVEDDSGLGSSGGSSLSTGAIIGIAVGGGLALIALLAGCLFCIRRRRRKVEQLRGPAPEQFMPPGHPYHNSVSEAGWSPAQTSGLVASASPYFSALEHDPRQGGARTVPPYNGPPVELPSEGAAAHPSQQSLSPDPARQQQQQQQQHGYFGDGTGTGSSGQSHARTVAADSEDAVSVGSPKFDAHGNNTWVPQVSMVQVYPHQPGNYTHQRRPSPGHLPQSGWPAQQQPGQGRWPPGQYQAQRQYSPSTTPRSESTPGRETRAFSELSAERLPGGEGSPRHETYYHP